MRCGVANGDGYQVTCQDDDPQHASPHSAGGDGWAMAWCTPPEPCRKGPCAGPCHTLDPRSASADGPVPSP